MLRKSFLLAAALASSATVAAFAPAASAGVSCSTDTAAEVAAAQAVDRGYNWSSVAQPDPLWEFTFADLDASVDLYAPPDLASAQAAAKAWLDGQVSALGCQSATTTTTPAAPAPAPAPTAPAVTYDQATVDQATTLAQSATVTNRGYAWSSPSQPDPLWTVSVPSLSMSVDVYAADDAGARQAALPAIEAQIAAHPPAVPTAPSSPTSTTTTTTAAPAPAAPATAPATTTTASSTTDPPAVTATSSTESSPAPTAPAPSTSDSSTAPAATTSSATTTATAPVVAGDIRSSRQAPVAGSTNPLLAGVLRSAFGHTVTIQNSTVCVVGPRVVACSQVFVTLGSGAQIQVTISDGSATRIAVRPRR